ncbi:MAG: hypothetical protein AAF492_03490 [Verrucomicrobiota bacterium]
MTKDELKKLPLRWLVALAVRCVQRTLNDAPEAWAEVVTASGAFSRGKPVGRAARRAVEEWTGDESAAERKILAVAKAAVAAEQAARDADVATDIDGVFSATVSMESAGMDAVGYVLQTTEGDEQARRDYDRLIELANPYERTFLFTGDPIDPGADGALGPFREGVA